jgi:hypothetical protein
MVLHTAEIKHPVSSRDPIDQPDHDITVSTACIQVYPSGLEEHRGVRRQHLGLR